MVLKDYTVDFSAKIAQMYNSTIISVICNIWK